MAWDWRVSHLHFQPDNCGDDGVGEPATQFCRHGAGDAAATSEWGWGPGFLVPVSRLSWA